jgi:hypothetical protein
MKLVEQCADQVMEILAGSACPMPPDCSLVAVNIIRHRDDRFGIDACAREVLNLLGRRGYEMMLPCITSPAPHDLGWE